MQASTVKGKAFFVSEQLKNNYCFAEMLQKRKSIVIITSLDKMKVYSSILNINNIWPENKNSK